MFSPILVITPAVTAQSVVEELVAQKLPKYDLGRVIWLCPPDQVIGIEELREWIYNLSYKLGADESRVYVIPQVNHALVEISHTLLKTLEEPPERTLILLTVDSVHGLLPTLVSRCQTYKSPSTKLSSQPDLDTWQKLADQVAKNLPANSVYQLWSLLPKTFSSVQAIVFLSQLSDLLLPWRLQPAGRQMLRQILVTISQLEQNTHVKLTVEHCLLQLYLLAKAVKTAPKLKQA